MDHAPGGAFVLGPDEGRSIDLGNFAMSVKATAAETAQAFTLLEAAEPAGFGPPMHIHHDTAEAFLRDGTAWKSSARYPRATSDAQQEINHMLQRVRRLLRTQDPPDLGDHSAGPSGEQTLAEGVYAGPGRITHYALDGRTRMLCGKPPDGLHRWVSSWSFVEPAKRCKRCDALIGDRANERHGAPTVADTLVFGVEPEGLSPSQRAEFRAAWERDAPRRQGDPPPPPGATFSDPPFIYAKDPARRRGSTEATYDRPINDVYTRVGRGKKWHRVYETHAPSPHAALAPHGRSFLLPCGNVGFEFERNDDGALYPAPLRTDAPPPAEMCKACAQSDAKYGRLGDLPSDRWDR